MPETLFRQKDCRRNTFKLATECSINGKETPIVFHCGPFDYVYLEETIGETYKGFYRLDAGLEFWRQRLYQLWHLPMLHLGS